VNACISTFTTADTENTAGGTEYKSIQDDKPLNKRDERVSEIMI
jgi:hypothetical protein